MTAPSNPISEATKSIVLQGIIQQPIKTILLYESRWYSCTTRNKETFFISEAFMVRVLIFILTWIIPLFNFKWQCYLNLGFFFFLCMFTLGSTLTLQHRNTHADDYIFLSMCSFFVVLLLCCGLMLMIFVMNAK